MSPTAFAAVGLGAACGAWLRWGLGLWLNPMFLMVPMGTLAANLLGGLLMGVALAVIQAWPAMTPALKLLLTTGLLGGLTTFSTMQVEVLEMIGHGRSGLALGYLAASVGLGLLAMHLATALVRRVRVR